MARRTGTLKFADLHCGIGSLRLALERAGADSVSLHSGRSQGQRQRALDGFRSGRYRVMVATDIAARGIDVQGISHVVNFDVPAFAQDYVHRIGRTGRAAATGDAITFVSGEEREYLDKIEKFIARKFAPKECAGFVHPQSGSVTRKRVDRSPSARARKTDASNTPHAARKRRRRKSKHRAM
jgi:ATP-dependent RNA helicase RhlE